MLFYLFSLFFAMFLSSENMESGLESYSFDRYLKDFGYKYVKNSREYMERKGLFEVRKAEVIAHNQDSTKTWKISMNKLSILKESEFRGLRGGRLTPRKLKNFAPKEDWSNTIDMTAPINIDWRTKGIITPVKNQGMCGSCWTFGAAETLESYWALATKKLIVLSEQQILDCTPNPNDCGGTGGCGGGTVELAWGQIGAMGGLSSEASYPYVSGGGLNQSCQMNQFHPIAKISGYVNLPSNLLAPTLNYLATKGPLAISVDASSWSSYSSGVFDGCNQANPDLDHVVQLVGAGTDPSYGDYWLVRNSWSASWGENGYIRLRRTATPRCGVDTSPQDGDGCNGGPSQVTVCGTCGILYDTLYPTVVQ